MTDPTLRELLDLIDPQLVINGKPAREIAEAICQEIAREARWEGAIDAVETYCVQLKKDYAELTHKPQGDSRE